jgi:hypothetical protein
LETNADEVAIALRELMEVLDEVARGLERDDVAAALTLLERARGERR